MPLEKGDKPEIISKNIEEMQAHGHPHEQAVAAALHTAAVSQTKQSGLGNATTVTLQNYTDISGTGAWTDSDKLIVSCFGY